MTDNSTKMLSPSGKRRPPRAGLGRPAGIPNKSTRAVKELLLAALHKVGGVDYLVSLAKNDPKTFATLVAKLIPQEVASTIDLHDARQITRIERIVVDPAHADEPPALPPQG